MTTMQGLDASELETLRRDILKGTLIIQNVLQKLQYQNITESDILLLTSEYRTEYKHLKQLVDEFERLVNEEDEDDTKDEVERYKNQLISLQASFRKANMQSQLMLNSKNKEELFYSSPASMEVRSRHGKSKEDLIKMSSNVTANLRILTQSMANVVEQSKGTLEVLEQSSRTITENREELKVMGSALVTTKKLVSRYARKENTTTIITVFAVLAFLLACVYIIQKRLF